jgi:hypothetical protein
MPSADYMRRLDSILTAKVEEAEEEHANRRNRPMRIVGAILGAIVFFFVLKGVALSHSGRSFSDPLAADAGIGAQIYHWFAGADPISATIAIAIRPATALTLR